MTALANSVGWIPELDASGEELLSTTRQPGVKPHLQAGTIPTSWKA